MPRLRRNGRVGSYLLSRKRRSAEEVSTVSVDTMRKPKTIQLMTSEEIESLPLTVGIVVAGRALGIGRDTSYKLAKTDKFPVPTIRAGKRYRVSRIVLLEHLGIPYVRKRPGRGARKSA